MTGTRHACVCLGGQQCFCCRDCQRQLPVCGVAALHRVWRHMDMELSVFGCVYSCSQTCLGVICPAVASAVQVFADQLKTYLPNTDGGAAAAAAPADAAPADAPGSKKDN